MDFNQQDEQNILKNTDANVDESTDTNLGNETDNSQEDTVSLKEKIQKLEEDYQNQKIRAEKAEAKLKNNISAGKGETSKVDGLSPFDLIAVTKANLDEEQLKEVMDIAKFKRIGIAEALKLPMTKAIIAEKEENKKVAEATSTGAARRGSSRLSDEALMSNYDKGILPESNEDIDRILKLRKKR